MMRVLRVVIALGLSAWPVAAVGGVLIVEKVELPGGAMLPHQTLIEKDWVRLEHYGVTGEKSAFVFDGTREVLTIVNYDRKIYNEVTRADLDRVNKQMAEALVRMKQQIASLPPDRRASVEEMVKASGIGVSPQITIFRKVGTDTVGSWACDKYEGYQNRQKTSEVCTVAAAALGFVPADFEVARRLAEFVVKLVPQNTHYLFNLGKPHERGFSGIPVRRRFTIGQKPATTEITEITRQDFPPSAFEVPADFAKKVTGER